MNFNHNWQFCHKTASEQIARIYGVDDVIWVVTRQDIKKQNEVPIFVRYITQDLGSLMELAIRNLFIIYCASTRVVIRIDSSLLEEDYADHNNDPIEATRVAIAQALIKKGGE